MQTPWFTRGRVLLHKMGVKRGREKNDEETSKDEREAVQKRKNDEEVQNDSVEDSSDVTADNEECSHALYRGGGLVDLSITFSEFGQRYLDRRLTKAITRTLQFEHPTLVQSAAIPLILQGKDVLARAKTGSGKTLAYALPIMQKILEGVERGVLAASPFQACVIVPTRELCVQVSRDE